MGSGNAPVDLETSSKYLRICGTRFKFFSLRNHEEEFQRVLAELKDRFRMNTWAANGHGDALWARARGAVRQVATPYMKDAAAQAGED